MAEYSGIERRRSPRVFDPDGIKVRIFDGHTRKVIPVCNISYHGALLSTSRLIDSGKILDIAIYIQGETKPIGMQARVIRGVTRCTAWGSQVFEVGIELINVARGQKARLTETLYDLFRKTPQDALV